MNEESGGERNGAAATPTVWLTYAWEDNHEGDVDYVAQQMKSAGMEVRLDRWNLQAGKRLWSQIEKFITDETGCDAWVLLATPASLGSEACKEEYAYALDRALNNRGPGLPVLGLLPSNTDLQLLPAGLRTRLNVSLEDPHWLERLKAAAEGRAPEVSPESLEPYALTVHRDFKTPYVLEVRPRIGTWSPFIAGVPLAEKEKLNPRFSHGPRGREPQGVVLFMVREAESGDGEWWLMGARNPATAADSYFIYCDELPSSMVFGVDGGEPQYTVSFDKQGGVGQ